MKMVTIIIIKLNKNITSKGGAVLVEGKVTNKCPIYMLCYIVPLSAGPGIVERM